MLRVLCARDKKAPQEVLFTFVGLDYKKSDCFVPTNANFSSTIGQLL